MADTVLGEEYVRAGFFNAKPDGNGKPDRTYTSEDMMMPYKDLITDGILVTDKNKNQITNFKVYSTSTAAGRAMAITAGKGIFAGRWFVLSSPISFNCDANLTQQTRKDLVVIRIDDNVNKREAKIIYRPGPSGGSASPINDAGVTEYPIARITVAPGAEIIGDLNIQDLRGLEHPNGTPWLASFVQKLSTEEYFNQWNAKFEELHQTILTNMADWQSALENSQNHMAIVSTPFMEAIQEVTDEVTISASTTGFGWLNGYDHNTEYICPIVTVNGYLLTRTVRSTFVNNPAHYMMEWEGSGASTLLKFKFKKELTQSQLVTIILLRSVTVTDGPAAITELQQMEESIQYVMPRGWSATINITLPSGITNASTMRGQEISDTVPKLAPAGGMISLRGVIKGFYPMIGTLVATIPDGAGYWDYNYRPDQDWYFTSVSWYGTITFRVHALTGQITVADTNCTQNPADPRTDIPWPLFTSWPRRVPLDNGEDITD